MPDGRFLWAHPAHFVALGMGTGLMPFAPGTWGSLLGLAVSTQIANWGLASQLTLILVLFALGIPICQRAGQALGVEDHGSIVWDEIVAMMLVMVWLPHTLLGYALGFVLFRCFDILKPYPIQQCEQRLRGGLGVMLDDLLAALYSLLTWYLIAPYVNPWM